MEKNEDVVKAASAVLKDKQLLVISEFVSDHDVFAAEEFMSL